MKLLCISSMISLSLSSAFPQRVFNFLPSWRKGGYPRAFSLRAHYPYFLTRRGFESHHVRSYFFGGKPFSSRAEIHFKCKNSNIGQKEEEDGGKKNNMVKKQQIEALDKMNFSTAGEIHVIVGPMFAGKTTALIHRVQTHIQMGRRVVLVKSDKDTRYGLNSVVSHDGVKMPCWVASDLASFKVKLGEEAYKKLDVIGIDEAQFFKDLHSFCQVAADRDGKIVIVAGLDGDFLRKSFGLTLDLIPIADSVTKLKSRCEMCGKPASFTLRKTADRETEIIGGADVYMPVCRQHYVNGQIVVDATRTLLESEQISCDIQVAEV